ncbi:MAG: acyl-CoA dehydrogenase [Thermoanaerobaculia bacterium]
MFTHILHILRKNGIAPEMSRTERAALEAGDVWIEGELFSGRPSFQRLLEESYPQLDDREQAFLDGPVDEVCGLVDREQTARDKELAPEVWKALKEHRFFGLALPERYGGHAFSALALSTIFGKLTTCSPTLSSVVLIPNSIGPGELLIEVGTDEQREHYLPRLARGDEIPCFALTEPTAGSDAGAMTSRGEVFRGDDGELYLRLDWNKRYITLAPIATLIGLAFRLFDPGDLLGKGEDVGITCALVPASLPGVEIGLRHDPLGVPFHNGPTRGRGVVIPVGLIIGGPEQAGRGWRMLMEALSGGRAISLPAGAAAAAKHIARVAGAYSVVRQQFGLSIGRFEGIEEPLARIAGLGYLIEAARVFTCGAVDNGHRPAVASAIVKYNTTELARRLAIDGMDILGGAAICRGPRNLMADAYIGTPIGITVEGANILTRTLIVFGQGAMRCHPHAHDFLEAIRTGDARAFRRTFFGQLGHAFGNTFRGFLLGLSRGRFAGSPVSGPTAKYYRRLAWASARYAFYVDLAMFTYGGKLKLRGKLTGRFADVLSWMYLGFTALRRYEAEGRLAEDLPLVQWSAEYALDRIQEGFEGIFRNFDVPLVGALLRGPTSWWARLNPIGAAPSDALGARAAAVLRQPGEQRDRLIRGLFRPAAEDHQLNRLEKAFELVTESAPAIAKIRRAIRAGELPKAPPEQLLAAAADAGVINSDEAELVERATAARLEAIQVDEMTLEELRGQTAPAAEPAPSPVAVAG